MLLVVSADAGDCQARGGGGEAAADPFVVRPAGGDGRSHCRPKLRLSGGVRQRMIDVWLGLPTITRCPGSLSPPL